MKTFKLAMMPQRLAICRLGPTDELPAAICQASFWSITRTSEELSLVIPEDRVPPGCQCVAGWRALQVAGPLDFTLTGVISALAAPLSQAEITLFALSTYDTDTILVREADLDRAIAVLTRAGHRVERHH